MRTATGAWRAAAAVALLAVGAAAATPVRSWLAQRATTEPSERAVPSTIRGVGDVWHSVNVAFTLAGDRLAVELDARPGDSLTLRLTTTTLVRARAQSRAADPVLVVLPTGVRLIGRGTAASRFEVELPPTVRQIDVTMRGRALAHVTRDALVARDVWRLVVP